MDENDLRRYEVRVAVLADIDRRVALGDLSPEAALIERTDFAHACYRVDA